MSTNLLAFWKWWAALLLLGAAAWPLIFYLFRRLPDRGLTLARPFGLLLVGYLFWLGASFGFWTNTAGSAAAAAIAVFAVGTTACLHARVSPWAWLGRKRRMALAQEAVFLLAFTAWAWVRANNPAAVDTEKPMELAFINSILRSVTFPPRDPWLSGYAISYYYFGYVLVAMLAKMAAVSGAYAFNLGVSSWYGMAGLAAYGLLSNLLALRERGRGAQERFRWAGLLAPLTLLGVGNFEGILEVLYNLHIGWSGQSGPFWQWLDILDLSSPPTSPATLDPTHYRFWWWWRASRVIQDRDLLGRSFSLQPIDEFPSFSFMLGDLHPHVLALPMGLAVLGLGLELLLRIWRLPGAPRRRPSLGALFPLPLAGFASLVLGGLAFLNTWDFPVYLLICAGATWLAWRKWGRPGLGPLAGRWGEILALGVLLYLPFYLSFSSQAAGVLPNLIFVTKGQQFAVMFGPLLIPVALWLGSLALSRRGQLAWGRGFLLAAGLAFGLFSFSLLLGALAVQDPYAAPFVSKLIQPMSVRQAVLALLQRRLVMPGSLIALVALLTLVFAALLPKGRKRDACAGGGTESSPKKGNLCLAPQGFSPAEIFLLLLVAVGAALVLVPEFVYLRDQFGARMNTVFKFYFQAWAYWSLAAAYGLVVLWGWRQSRSQAPSHPAREGGTPFWIRLSCGLAVAGLLLGFLYTPLSVWTKTSGFGLGSSATLDASAHLELDDPADAQAIAWINSNLKGGPMAEAVGGDYTNFARISTYTGLPTVLGWPGHEGQWRGGYNEIGSRQDDMAQLYRTQDWTMALNIIERYQIQYVYYGPLEIQAYGSSGLAKFQAHLRVAYHSEQVTIFEVEPNASSGGS
ncbi:MAG: DUF2298 domain-containing protein [Anaerolineales bacterium]|jgi:YYY domain-containing protein